jgi:hypothetical protein
VQTGPRSTPADCQTAAALLHGAAFNGNTHITFLILAASTHAALWPADACAGCHQVVPQEGVLLELQQQAEEHMQRLDDVVIHRHIQQCTHQVAVGQQVQVLQDSNGQSNTGQTEQVDLASKHWFAKFN